MDVSGPSADTIAVTPVDSIHKGQLLHGLLEHLKGMKLYSKESTKERFLLLVTLGNL